MATTTNFGWETPDDTDLVKDGAAAIRTLGSSIDSSLVDLKGGTTGQVLAKNSGTDMDFIWVAQDDSNAIQNAIVDAKGDLISATAADTPARLAVGTNGQVLTADSAAATGLTWTTPSSGGMTLLSTTTLNSGTTTQTISGMSADYKELFIVLKNMRMSAGGGNFDVRLNSDSGSNYMCGRLEWYWAGASGEVGLKTTIRMSSRTSQSTSWNKQGYATFRLVDYNAAGQCQVDYTQLNHDGQATENNTIWFSSGKAVYNATSAVTSITFIGDTNFTSGTVLVYGVK